MANKFPNMVDDEAVRREAAGLRSMIMPETVENKLVQAARGTIGEMIESAKDMAIGPIGSRPGRSVVRVVAEVPPPLRSRLMALSFETGISVAAIMRYALWEVVLSAEGNKEKFCERVARARLKHRE